MSNDIKLKATEIEFFLETGEVPSQVNDAFEKILTLFKEEGNKNFILGKVIIDNDLDTSEADGADDE